MSTLTISDIINGRNKLIALMVCLSCALSTLAIKNVVVVSPEKKGIAKASVSVCDSTDNILSFTYTSHAGLFSLKEIPKNSRILNVRAMGYESRAIPIENVHDNDTIRLLTKSTTLQEVTVKGDRGYISGDTINYFVSAFAKGSDKSIADVLKRMPGVDVEKDGSISVNGKDITELKVEGLNLMGNRYAQVSENLKAKTVAKVQILQNNQPIKMLRDINFSDNIAINLVLKDEYKSVWQNGLELGAGAKTQNGAKFLSDSKAMSMMFSKKMQSMSLYKFNNTGKDVWREIKGQATMSLGDAHLISPPTVAASNLNANRYRDNISNIAASNWLIPINKDAQFRVNLSGGIEKDKRKQYRTTQYMTIEGMPEVVEEISSNSDIQTLFCDMIYTLNADTKYINNRTSMEFSRNNALGSVTLNDITSQNQYRLPTTKVSNHFSFQKKTKNRNVYGANLSLSYSNLPDYFSAYNGVTQNSDQKQYGGTVSTKYTQNFGRLRLTVTPTLTLRRQNLSIATAIDKVATSSGTSTPSAADISQFPTIDEKDVFDLYSATFNPTLDYKVGKVEFQASCDMLLNHYNLTQNGKKSSDTYFRPKPSMRINYKPTNKITVSSMYSQNWQMSSLKDLIRGPYFVGPTSARENEGIFYTSSSNMVNGSFNYTDPISGWNGSLIANWIRAENQALSTPHLVNGITVATADILPTTMTTQMIMSRFGKFFDFMNLDLSVNPSLTKSNSKVMMADQLTNQQMLTLSLFGKVSISPFPWFELYYTPQLSKGYSKLMTGMPITRTSNSWTNYLEGTIYIGKMHVRLINEWFNPQGLPQIHFADISAEYKADKFYIGLEVNNLMGVTEYKNQFLSSLTNSILSVPLRGREFLLRFSFDL